jgi:hypothetical protein
VETPHHLVVFALPQYAVYLALIAAGIERLVGRRGPVAAGEPAHGAAGGL